ncbi:MAG: ABC transporter substrate-binding protein [Candidatus Sumerlaeaceae bacterium]|nr:ABC transporter substrate-binding protein [Candidatus Sumerlaeaceae bacterium]
MSRNCLIGLAVAAVAVGFLVGGCGRATPSAAGDKVFNFSLSDEPRRLDPAFVKDYHEGVVSGLVFEGLVVFGTGAEVEPGLAERWEISPDGRVYTFHLRRDARFSDGRPVTSTDVRYSFTRVLRPETGSDRRWVLDRIEGADEVISGTAPDLRGLETPDAHTVVLRLRAAYPVFLTLLAMPTAAIIPDGSAGTGKPDPVFTERPIGSGPWVLDRWLRDQRLEFRRNQHYAGTPPFFERINCLVQAEDSVRLRQFEVGNLDLYQVGFQVWSSWSADPQRRERMMPLQEPRTEFIGLMCHKEPFSDARVRRAARMSVDVSGIFEHVQKGRGVVARGPVPPGIAGYRADLPAPLRDLERARALLAESGVNAASRELRFFYRDEALNAEIVRFAASNLREAGFTVVPVPVDLATLRQSIWDGVPDLFLGSWHLDYPDIENALVPTFHSRNIPRQGNQVRFSDPETDRLLETAEQEGEAARRLAIFQQAEDRINSLAPWIPLFHRRSYHIVQPNVIGYTPKFMYNAERFIGVSKAARR